MALSNLTWNACGSEALSTNVYYGKTLLVTGTPPGGTGWVLHTGASLPNSANSTAITIDDNVEYTFRVQCNCTSLTGGQIVFGPSIKIVCPTGFNASSTNPTVINYTFSVPMSVANVGTWIQKITVDLLDSTGLTVLASNDHISAGGSVNGTFSSGLVGATSYKLRIKYSNTAATKTHNCGVIDITTAAPCVIPTVTMTNITNNSASVNISPLQSGETYNVVLNGTTIATGQNMSPYTLTGLTANTLYTVNIVKTCPGSGTATGTVSFKSVSIGNNSIEIKNETAGYYIDAVKINNINVTGYVTPTAPNQTKYASSSQTGDLSVATDDPGGRIEVLDTYNNLHCLSIVTAYVPVVFQFIAFGGPNPIKITYKQGDNCP